MLKAVRTLQSGDHFHEANAPFKHALRSIPVVIGALFIAHLHACVHGLIIHHVPSSNMYSGFHEYYKSFAWSYIALTVGVFGGLTTKNDADDVGLQALRMFISSERLMLMILCGSWIVYRAISLFEQDARLALVKRDAMKYFQRHKISIETQIQVLYSLHETKNAQQLQRHFQRLMSQHLPEELHRRICEELWATRLMSLGLVLHIAHWHDDMLTDLALIVQETCMASRSILFKEGNASIAAYHVLQGRLCAMSSTASRVPGFSDGMWIGEKALVNPTYRRKSTVVTELISTLMTVPSEKFQEVLQRHGLVERFIVLCKEQIGRGLCGRCGLLGDHFPHECPTLERNIRSFVWIPEGNSKLQPLLRRIFGRSQNDRRRLQKYLEFHCLERIAPVLRDVGVHSIRDLENLNLEKLHSQIARYGQGMRLSAADEEALTREYISLFQKQAANLLDELLPPTGHKDSHLVFLSHYKVEGGTEAALIRAELMDVMKEEDTKFYKSFQVPVFLDSEDLYNLRDLRDRVRCSHNLVLLCTANVLTRPWVPVEIATAVDAGVRVLPVQVIRAGHEFHFPDEAFYDKLLQGSLLEDDGNEVLRQSGIKLEQAAVAVREVFSRISMSYSPHRAAGIRRAELRALLKQCRFGRITRGHTQMAMRNEFPSAIHRSSTSSCASNSSADDSGILIRTPVSVCHSTVPDVPVGEAQFNQMRAPQLRPAIGQATIKSPTSSPPLSHANQSLVPTSWSAHVSTLAVM